MRRCLSYVVAIVALTTTGGAKAQSPKVAAEALFDEGRKLVAEGKPALACPKFADSQRLDPSPSTLLNLASCYERLGKTASAWATYKEAASLATATGRTPLVSVAQKHAAALEPQLARLAIHVADPTPGLEIRRDGAVVGPGEWGVGIPVDPGAHRVDVSAPDKKPWSSSIDVADAGATARLEVPALEDAPAPPPSAAPPPAPVAQPARPVTTTPVVTSHETSSSPQKTIALVTGGVGIAGLAVGTVYVLVAKSKYDDSRDKCPVDKNLCTQEGVSQRDDARRAGNIATIAYGVGAAALASGIVLFATAPSSRDHERAGVRVSPTASGVLVDGRF